MGTVNRNLKSIVAVLGVGWQAYQTAYPASGHNWAQPVAAAITAILVWLVPNEPAVLKEIETDATKVAGALTRSGMLTPPSVSRMSAPPGIRATQASQSGEQTDGGSW